ncbi:RNA polymerase subunit sigma [Corynebacterium striatum]|uniref:RNA polymerase subunit sigma n=1 Tax=Corynebacterium striatum TaxID=43770 RepID=A0A2Z2IZ07_CORST|nr:sigma-70 family RNA polymerase sigma factor [Corynebacterium striatum]ART20265.1 RNA polymerase subunit sigma [Corynebacterium striatum]HCG2962352.1 sigma-70 family RNA polymerase sigma factor [Corynebacterium striatum]
MADRSDHELVDAFIAGDNKAFSLIVERHRARLAMVARRYTHNDTDAQDVLQEALLRASCNLHKYRRESALSTWLHRLVMNSGYDFLNHRANRENASLDVDFVEDDRNHLLAHNPNENLEDTLALREAMELLHKDHREALYWTDVEGYAIAEVAALQGVAPGTIKSRRARARRALREAMLQGTNT